MTTMISVRVPKKIRDEAKRLGINISEVVRKALEEEIRKAKMRELKELGMIVEKIIERIGKEKMVMYVRESKDER